MSDKDFDKIVYKKPFFNRDSLPINRFVGVDSETRKTGIPFLIATSENHYFGFEDVPQVFFDPRYNDCDFALWNMKFDSGSLLYSLPVKLLNELRETNSTVLIIKNEIYHYKYIPHKYLEIKKEKESRRFWEIEQYYNSSLNYAAKKYLNSSKHDLDASKFTDAFIKRNFKKIVRYCIQDAVLTRDLAELFKSKLEKFSITVSKIYSSASISFDYFKSHGPIVSVYRFWKENKSLLRYAHNSYQGGKFEVTARGSIDNAYEYDIVSAYPYEIANLVDISKAKVVRSKRYHKSARYGFLFVYVSFPRSLPHSPNGIKRGPLRIYPVGQYYTYLTKAEYEYMIEIGFDITIIDAYWLHVDRIDYPYRSTIADLFAIKDAYKSQDPMLYMITKIMMNGFYGKTLQLTEMNDKTYRAGSGWNPIYGAVITANTRIRMTRLQNELGKHCLAVHTDSVITDVPINELSNSLGGLKFELQGPALLIASGMYDINTKCAYRGFIFRKDFSWKKLLEENPENSFITFDQKRVISWTQALAWSQENKINVFEKFKKKIDLNCDQKRLWFRKVKAKNLLEKIQQSGPLIHYEKYFSCKVR